MSAMPSVPTKMAMAFEVKKPEIIRIKIANELSDAILINTLFLSLWMKLFNDLILYLNFKSKLYIYSS